MPSEMQAEIEAVLASGNEVGLTEAQWEALDPAQQQVLREKARQRLMQATPDFWVDTVSELPGLMGQIDQRLAQGMRPGLLPD